MDAPLLKADNLSFGYNQKLVLDDVSLAIKSNEFVGLIGANGTGKTTLMRVLLNLLNPQTGKVFLDGDLISGLNRREIARRAALVEQETTVDFDFTAREIVAMGRTPYLGRFKSETRLDQEIISRMMRETDTEVFAERLITELSGGERQRVHLARALAQETKLILLDEPTANLDLAHQFETLRLIKKFTRTKSKAALAAIHDLSLAARFCDRLLLLSKGKIVADGKPGEVVTEENLQRHFALRARIKRDEESGVLLIFPISEE